MMLEQLEVQRFHEKHNFLIGLLPGQHHETDLVRVSLISEENGELALALARKDIVKVADAIGDLLYVVVGAAVTYGIPLDEVFREIQKSNMTKAVRQPGDTRLRTKGDSYVPPDLESVLRKAGLIADRPIG